jgi:hypothetical protein
MFGILASFFLFCSLYFSLSLSLSQHEQSQFRPSLPQPTVAGSGAKWRKRHCCHQSPAILTSLQCFPSNSKSPRFIIDYFKMVRHRRRRWQQQ